MTRLAERRKDLVNAMMKDGIYEAAIKVLCQQGVEGLTMDRVAEAAGIAKGSLYNYFRSKRELLQFVHDKTIEPAKRAVEKILVAPLGAVEKLEAILKTWFEHFATHRGVFSFLFNDPVSFDSSKKSGRVDALKNFGTVVRQGIDEGAFRPVDPIRTAELFFGAVVAVVEQQVFLDEQRPADESVAAVMDFFLHGVSAGG